ncbi:MAG: DEAD/DEAH box helicase [Hallerella sp.]|jgi:ATP-dependent RNA helicase RhlE|nr:DEAD/DEAH box helicase [Hallerella sp.]
MKFSELPLDERLQRAIVDANYTAPTPIQEKAIPPVLEHKDLMGIAQTGTGKTAAFALPILQNLLQGGDSKGQKPIRVLVLLPTRELAIQVSDCFEKYQKYTRLTSACIFGGVSDLPQKRALSRGVDTLIATPGRLLDLINQRVVSLKKLEYFVLDEADRMLDMGFIHDIKKVVALLPQKRQNLFFSATMPPEITKLAASILRTDPVRVEVAPQSTPIERIRQELYRIDKRRKGALLKEMLLEHPEMKKVLVFSRTKHGADKIVRVLEKAKVTCAAIHGNKSQNRRQEALGNFKTEQIRVLVATDIAARGIDVDNVTHVFNYDLPDVPETFVHRIGRTARAGRDGVAISFCAPDEEQDLRAIEKLTRVQIPEGDKAIFEKLPPPQKETPESEARNSRWRTGKFGGRKAREQKKESAKKEPSEPQAAQKQNANPTPKTHTGKRLGSRARRRLREEQAKRQQSQNG